jgi:hypothetical protein
LTVPELAEFLADVEASGGTTATIKGRVTFGGQIKEISADIVRSAGNGT